MPYYTGSNAPGIYKAFNQLNSAIKAQYLNY